MRNVGAREPGAAAPLSLTLVALSPGEVVYLSAHMRRANPDLLYQARQVDRLADAEFDSTRVHAVVFSTTSALQASAADLEVLRQSTMRTLTRGFVLASPESPPRTIPPGLKPLVAETADQSAESVASEIMKFSRMSNAMRMQGPFVLCGYALLAALSYVAAILLAANFFVVRSGGAPLLARFQEWRVPDIATCFGTFFLFHCVAVILWILATARRDRFAEFDLPRFAGLMTYATAIVLTVAFLYWIGPSVWNVLLAAVFALFAHIVLLGALRSPAGAWILASRNKAC